MKHFTLKSVLVIAVFFIGVSINNSCGESPIDDNLSSMYNSIRTLQNEVTNLRQEIKRLDSEISALKSTSGGSQSGTACSEKYIDGLYFDRNGMVSSKINTSTNNQNKGYNKYIYDAQGRLIEIEYIPQQSTGVTGKQSYEYSGKTVTYTSATIYDPDKFPQISNSIFQTITEYY